MNQIISRAEARSQQLTSYFTGIPCPNGHVSNRNTKDGGCNECSKMRSVSRRLTLPTEASDRYHADRERRRQQNAAYYERTKDARARYSQQYYSKESNRVSHQAACKNWRDANIEKLSEDSRIRRSRQIKARVSWGDRESISALYKHARYLTQTTGVLHVVDHIVPLRGASVCGLHWEGNLQVITQVENLLKSNKMPAELQMERG